MPDLTLLFLYIPVFLFSLTVHEFAHAWTAKLGGDLTSAYQGRLTLNPIPHIDPIGTIVLPLLAFITNFPLLGWAKPVPVNHLKFRHSRWIVWVSIAGPISNVIIALVAALLFRGMIEAGLKFQLRLSGDLLSAVGVLLMLLVRVNVMLAVFNMIPIPPLDGSKVFYYYFCRHNPAMERFYFGLQQFGFMILYLFILFDPLEKVLHTMFRVPMDYMHAIMGI